MEFGVWVKAIKEDRQMIRGDRGQVIVPLDMPGACTKVWWERTNNISWVPRMSIEIDGDVFQREAIKNPL